MLKYPIRSNFRKKGFISMHSFRGGAPSWQGKEGGGSQKQLIASRPQRAEKGRVIACREMNDLTPAWNLWLLPHGEQAFSAVE